jgi:hypothetical protein
LNTGKPVAAGPARFFVALLLASLGAAASGFVVLVLWHIALGPTMQSTSGFNSVGNIVGAVPGLSIFVMFVTVGVMLFGGLPAIAIGIVLLRARQTSLGAFLLGGFLAGAIGYIAFRALYPAGASFGMGLLADFHAGFLAGTLIGALTAGLIGHRILVDRRKA